jgi:hypothetical protein
MTITRRDKGRVRSQPAPWERFAQADCACSSRLPCLLHFDDLDWQGRALAYDLAEIKPAVGR